MSGNGNSNTEKKKQHFATLAIHGGQQVDHVTQRLGEPAGRVMGDEQRDPEADLDSCRCRKQRRRVPEHCQRLLSGVVPQ